MLMRIWGALIKPFPTGMEFPDFEAGTGCYRNQMVLQEVDYRVPVGSGSPVTTVRSSILPETSICTQIPHRVGVLIKQMGRL